MCKVHICMSGGWKLKVPLVCRESCVVVRLYQTLSSMHRVSAQGVVSQLCLQQRMGPSKQSKQRNWDLLAKGRNVRAGRPRELFLLHFSCQVDSEPNKSLSTIYDSCLEFQDMLYYEFACFNVKSPNTHLVAIKSLLNDYNHPTTL